MIKKWKQKAVACLTALTLVGTMMPQNPFGLEWSKEVKAAEISLPDPTYLFDFEGGITKDGASPVTNGTTGKVEIVEDAVKGNVLHITDGGTESFGQNYYKLPEDIFKGVTAETGATVSMWTKIPTEIVNEWSVLFSSSTGYNSWNLWKFNANRVCDINAGTPNVWGSTANTGTTGDGKTPVEKDTWHQITATLSKEVLNVYLDGILIGTTPATGGDNHETQGWSNALIQLVNNTFNTLGAGGFPGEGRTGDRDISDCYYDDVAIYSIALTAEQSKELYYNSVESIEKVKVESIQINDILLPFKYEQEGFIIKKSASIIPEITYTPVDPDIKTVIFETDNTDIIKLEGNKIVALKAGNAKVKAISQSTSKASTEFNVTVSEPLEFGKVTSDFVVDGYASEQSGFEKIIGDFDIIYTFNNQTTGEDNWHNFIFEVTNGEGAWLTVRADAYKVEHNFEGESNYGGEVIFEAIDDWETFRQDMKDSNVIVNANRNGNKLIIKYHIMANKSDNVYDIVATMNDNADASDELYIHLTGEKVKISNITLAENKSFDLTCLGEATLGDETKNVKIGDSIAFTATPSEGYTIEKVTYDGTDLIENADGKYEIPFVTEAKEIEITTTAIEYSISYVIDGKDDSTVTVTAKDAVEGKVALKELSNEADGWYLSSEDKINKITNIAISDLIESKDGSITVYGYNPYKISMDENNPTSFQYGTIEALEIDKSYYMGDEVVIVTKPKEGFAANVTVTAEDGTKITTTASSEGVSEGVENVIFKMPASNVIITYGEFIGVDSSKLEAAIEAAKTLYDAGNEDAKYTVSTWEAFKKAYDDAVAAIAKENPTQAELDTAQTTLETTKEALVYSYKLTLDKETASIIAGESITLVATVTTAGTDKSVIWTSSDEKVATVTEDGKVTAIAAGKAVITATAADQVTTATCEVTVTIPITYEVKLDKESATIKIGESITLVPTVTTTGTDESVTWTSSDEKVATVTGDGKVTAIAVGEAVITATAADKETSAECKITVVSESVEPTPEGHTYFFDFENDIVKDGASPVTNGSTGKVEIVEDAERGKVLHITDGGTESFGQNYYKLPEDIFKGVTAETGATVSMWTKIPTEIVSEWSVLFSSSIGYNSWNLWKFNANRVCDINAGDPNVWGSTVNTGTTGDGLTPVEKDTWHQIIATLSKEALNVYLDGVLIGTTPATGGDNHETQGWSNALIQLANNTFNTLGAGGFPGEGKTKDRDISDCYYDDVAIYPTALTAEKVKELYTNAQVKVIKVVVTPETATAFNEYVYASEEDKEAGKVQATRLGTVQLSASVKPLMATIKDIVWSIDEADIEKANIDQTGLVTLTENVKEGDKVTVYATAKDGSEIKGSSIITISIKETVGPAKTEELEAAIAATKPIYEAGNEENIYTTASWDKFKEAYDTAVKAMEAVAQGEIDNARNALIKAQEELIYKCIIILDKEAETIKVGESFTLIPTVTTTGTDESVTWASSNEAVATVEDGKVTAIAVGEAIITATAADKETSASCKVTVIPAVVDPEEPIEPEKPLIPNGYNYIFDFEDDIVKDGASPVTNGSTGKVEIVEDAERGKVLHITDGGTESFGQNYYKLPEDIFKNVTVETGATVSMWTKIPTEIVNEWSVLFSSNPAYAQWGLWKVNANLVSDINGGEPWAYGSTGNDNAISLEKDTWNQITMTLSKEVLTVYLNGKSILKAVPAGGAETYTRDGWTGILNSLKNNVFNTLGAGGFPTDPISDKTGDRDISDCYYDNVVIYPTALTEEEVHQLYIGVPNVPEEPEKPVPPVEVTGITLNKTEMTLEVGSNETLTAVIMPENATNKEVQWTSDDEKVATVDVNGKVTAIAVGNTIIKATAVSNSSITASCAITVKQTSENPGGDDNNNNTPTIPGGSTNPGGSSSGSISGGTTSNTNSSNNTGDKEPENTTSNDNNTQTPSTTTKPDGTIVETSKETTEDGTVKETVKETSKDGAVKETIKETSKDGTIKETIKETTKDNNVTKETVTETAPNGKVTTEATVTDQKNAAVLNTVVEKDANGNITKANAVISAGAADLTVTGKKASVDVNVSDTILNAAAENEDIDSVVIEITKPVLSSAYANKNVTNGVIVNVTIDAVNNVEVSNIVLTSESIAEAKAAGQKLTINVITKNEDKSNYKVVIPAKQLKKITNTTKPIDIMVETVAANKLANDSSKGKVSTDVKNVLTKSKAKQNKTYVLSIAENENLKAGMKITADVNKDTAISPNQTVYVYKYNEKTGKFVEVANSKQKVSANGTISIDAKSGTNYVVSSKKLSGSQVTTIKSQIKANINKSSVKAGKSIVINVELPATLKEVKSFGGGSTFGKEQAIVLYESSDNKIATVTAKGTIKAKKAGKVTITITVGTEGGQTKKIKKTITVK